MQISRREFTLLMSSVAVALATPSALAQALRVRREIRTLPEADIDALKAGVQAMRALPKADLHAWLYQAGVHGAPAADSAGVPDAATYWNQCVHFGLHFLSWHRWELLFIEEIMRQMSGYCSFALPYWDYLADGFLPDPLRQTPDGNNPLYDGTRIAALNNGTAGLSGMNLDALDEAQFPGFSGILYGNPHSAVHGQVSGNMGSVPTAARDPVFYLHHCNIDRYWECWSRKGGSNPGGSWPGQTFPFRTVTGHRDARAGDAGRTANLGYTYDNLPCGRLINPALLDLLRELRYLKLRVRPRPIPEPDPWPWRPAITTEPFEITTQPVAFVLAQSDLQKAGLAKAILGAKGTSAAIVLHGVKTTDAARKGGFFIDAWIAPADAMRSGKTDSARHAGSFSSFDLSMPADHARHHATVGATGAPSIALPLSEDAMRLLAGSKGDIAVVFVRRGLVDRKNRPIDDGGQATLFHVEGMGLGIAAASR